MTLLDHPDLIHLYELYEDSSLVYLIMDLLIGGSLSSFLKLYKPLSENSLSKMMFRLLEGV